MTALVEPEVPGEPVVLGEPVVPSDLLDFIKEGESFLIAGHNEPDGDCVGSQLALESALRRLGKKTLLCSAGPFNRTEIKSYESLFCFPNVNPASESRAKVILVDCSCLDRTGEISGRLEGLPLAVIDHHGNGDGAPFSGENPGFIDKNAAATTILVTKLILALGLELTRDEADFLFFGLCTDTGFFRHVDAGKAEPFETAAFLVRSGANPKAAYSAINGGRSLDSRRLIGHALVRSESLFDGKLILSSEELEEISRLGTKDRDSDSLYRLFQSVEGVEAIVIIRQETPEKCAVNFRSRSWVDVGSIAGAFGGGGHKNAAGASIEGTIAELRQKIIGAFENIFS